MYFIYGQQREEIYKVKIFHDKWKPWIRKFVVWTHKFLYREYPEKVEKIVDVQNKLFSDNCSSILNYNVEFGLNSTKKPTGT